MQFSQIISKKNLFNFNVFFFLNIIFKDKYNYWYNILLVIYCTRTMNLFKTSVLLVKKPQKEG